MIAPPPFLHVASPEPDPEGAGSFSGVFKHKSGDAHARWWPCAGSHIRTVFLFIPGNPGLVDFYIPFLSALHDKFRTDGLAILAHAHLGHSPHVDILPRPGLSHQPEAALEVFDSVKASWPDAKVILVGHSVGSWIAIQVLKARQHRVDAIFMLFPTISNIAQTPNGKRLSWLFHAPIALAISQLSVLIRPIYAPLLSLLFPSWPAHQKAVLGRLVCSPRAILACLTMARDEMRVITTPDVSLLHQHSSKLWLYYAEKDHWVGKERQLIIDILGDTAAVRVVHCKHGVPHAFCIRASIQLSVKQAVHSNMLVVHGDLIAAQCADWLRQGGFCGA